MPIDETKALEICNAYGLNDLDAQKSFVTYATTILGNVAADIMIFVKNDMKPAVALNANDDKTKCSRLIRFANHLNDSNFGTDAYERADCILRTNRLFEKKWTSIQRKYKSLKDAAPEMNNLRKDYSPSFKDFVKARKDAVEDVLGFRAAFIAKGSAATNAYEVIHYFHSHGINFSGLTTKRCVKLLQLSRLAPAHIKYTGFSAWGPGDASDKKSETNKKNHFVKHVLDADSKASLTWKDELKLWWVELGIKLKRVQAKTNLTSTEYQAVKDLFGVQATDDTELPPDQVVAFLAEINKGTMSQGFKDFMYKSYGTAYCDRALEVGRNMKNGMVHSVLKDERLVYITGRVSTIWVAGRLDDTNQVRLSSCYFAQNINQKMNDRIKIWDLTTS